MRVHRSYAYNTKVMRIDPAGYPLIGGALLVSLLIGWIASWPLAIPFAILGAFFLFFFRDPERTITNIPQAVLSPADGRVLMAGATTGQTTPPGNWQQISIFLSPMDVHVNRVPVGGRIVNVQYHPGRFLPAYRADAGDLNEFTEVWVDHDGEPVVFRQIVGILARRIVCRAREGDVVRAGDRFGIMKFGSRMDVFLPTTARLMVKPGDHVIGGVSVIAHLAGLLERDAQARAAERELVYAR